MAVVKILLRDQEYCVINGGTATKYLLLGRGACQGDPTSPFFSPWWYNLDIFFSYFLRLKLNLTKPEIGGIGVLKEVQVALHRSKYWYIKNIRYLFLLQRKIERGEKVLQHCNRYSTSFENPIP